MVGKDIFVFEYFLGNIGKFKPIFYERTRTQLVSDGNWMCTKNSNAAQLGNACAALIMKDGWRIADDYPW